MILDRDQMGFHGELSILSAMAQEESDGYSHGSPDEKEAERTRPMFRMVLDGECRTDIIGELNAMETGNGTVWKHDCVKDTMKSFACKDYLFAGSTYVAVKVFETT